MTKKIKGTLAAVAALVVLAIGGAAIAGAAGGGQQNSGPTPAQSAESAASQDAKEGPDQSISGSALDKANAAALQETGGGQVTATEVRDEEGYYEVEVKKTDGSEIDVHLDRNFNVLDSSADSESGDSGSS